MNGRFDRPSPLMLQREKMQYGVIFALQKSRRGIDRIGLKHMINITINGKATPVDASATVADVARQHGVDENASGVAIAVNDTVVPKREWATRRIAAGDVVEIIRAVQGG